MSFTDYLTQAESVKRVAGVFSPMRYEGRAMGTGDERLFGAHLAFADAVNSSGSIRAAVVPIARAVLLTAVSRPGPS